MTLLIVSFLAGVLTIMAPCILPLLPVIVGGSIAGGQSRWYRPLVIAGSLAVSVTIFTLLLKATAALLGVPTAVWNGISGVIVILLGLSLLFPAGWERLASSAKLSQRANRILGSSNRYQGLTRDITTGAALGPVFSSCSPTYAFIVAAVLPQSFAQGFAYILAYAFGLALALLLVALAGQAIASKLAIAANPHGWFMRTIGLLFIVVGVSVLFGLDRQFQSFVLEQGWYDPISNFEQSLGVE